MVQASGNSADGVFIFDSPNNTVGGTMLSSPNVISGNQSIGIEIVGNLATGNHVEGNIIGADINISKSIPNFSGVSIRDAPGNTIGGLDPAASNLISGNSSDGILISAAVRRGTRSKETSSELMRPARTP